ncbi:hypothetical protein LMH87_011953 [Akanthomyces muscarius]|uniref:Uncharacterized protein n=1 Tax=Akanthomyces muscarius TaxID=2231603 RepID=A0A9W8QAR0_AKAMU|nr:hypothetical protein LMH87_011953 [Akanthomyces muscarius]KAJ4151240.1 hypothetical protein LMH87_011953 [Akanthomyces muscarius]
MVISNSGIKIRQSPSLNEVRAFLRGLGAHSHDASRPWRLPLRRLPHFKRAFDATWRPILLHWVALEFVRWVPTVLFALLGVHLPEVRDGGRTDVSDVTGTDAAKLIVIAVSPPSSAPPSSFPPTSSSSASRPRCFPARTTPSSPLTIQYSMGATTSTGV